MKFISSALLVAVLLAACGTDNNAGVSRSNLKGQNGNVDRRKMPEGQRRDPSGKPERPRLTPKKP